MFAKIRALWRLLRFIYWIICGVILALVFLKANQQGYYSGQQSALIRWWMKKLLHIMGISLVHNKPSLAPIWVANHISWCDIVVLMAIEPRRFLSKHEVSSWPIIGWLAQRAGTVFIKRGGHQASQATEQLAQRLRLGDRIVFFPEGTSQGDKPKKFHARLFALPIQERVAVVPVSLVYQDRKSSLRSDISYTGNQSFIQNIWYLLQQQDIVARITFMPEISSERLSRNDLADACQGSVTCGWQSSIECHEVHQPIFIQ